MELVKEIIKYGNHFGYIEVNLINEEANTVFFGGEKMKFLSNGKVSTLGVRITKKNGKSGFSLTTDIKKWKECINEANKICSVSPPDMNFKEIPKPSKSYPKIFFKGLKKIKNLQDEELLKSANSLVSSCKVDKKITSSELFVNKTINKDLFANSNGVYLSEEKGSFGCQIEVKIKDVSATEGKTSLSLFDVKETGKKAGELCLSSLNPRKTKTQKTNVILDYFALSSLIESAFMPSLSAENVWKRKSFYFNKLNQKVMSNLITITDDGTLKNGLITSSYDGEGNSTKKTVILEKGVLKNFLFDEYTAGILKKKTTGNCFGITSRPSISPTNLIIKSGSISREEMIKNTKNGILITSFSGTHLSNPITGDFSFELINSFEIKDGELYPIKGAMMSGNVFKIFNNVLEVSKETRQESFTLCPVIKFKDIQIIS